MKKLISLVCTASIMASILAPVASAINLSNEAQTVRYSTEIAGKQADVEYRLENGEVTYAKITAGENVTERIGNIIYLNGVKMATIHEEPANYEDETVQPCTGWMKQDKCLYGTVPADYTKPISEKNRNIELENKIMSYTIDALSLAITIAFGVSGDFLDLATDLLKNISTMANNAQYKTLYFHEVIKGHKTLPSMWQQVKCKYYVDSAHKKFACNDTFYRAWG